MAAIKDASREDSTPVMGEPGASTDVFESLDYKSPMDFTRLKAKPWKNATHGRYKDIFNLQALSPSDK